MFGTGSPADFSEAVEFQQSTQELACHIFGGKGFSKFDLTPLMKTDGLYKYEGYEWNLCTYLPRSSIFARQIDLMAGTHALTTENYLPEETSVIEDSQGKIIGLNYVRSAD